MNRNRSRKAKSLRAARGSKKSSVKKTILNPGMGEKSSITRMTMAASTIVPFKYLVHGILNNVGGVRASNRYDSDAYDVDPALGSTAMPGFAEWATLYQRFRPLRMKYEYEIANNETFNIVVLSGFSAGVSVASGSLGIVYAGNPYWKCHTCGPLTGSNKVVTTDTREIADIFGTKQVLYDDLYTGSTTSSSFTTASKCMSYIGIVASGVNVFAAGVECLAEITLWVQLYKPTFLTS